MATSTPQTSDDAPSERLSAEATEKLLKAIGTGNPPPGGGGSGVEIRLSAVEARVGQMETRWLWSRRNWGTLEAGVARVEATAFRLHENAGTDFHLIFGALIATALGLAGMMAKGFHWI